MKSDTREIRSRRRGNNDCWSDWGRHPSHMPNRPTIERSTLPPTLAYGTKAFPVVSSLFDEKPRSFLLGRLRWRLLGRLRLLLSVQNRVYCILNGCGGGGACGCSCSCWDRNAVVQTVAVANAVAAAVAIASAETR